jgi:hypothetical protein
MIITTLLLLGLVAEIVGVLVLAVGETAHHMAFARYVASADSAFAWQRELLRYSWWKRPLIRIATRLGSRNPADMGDEGPLESLATKLLGYATIFVGFVLQAFAVIVAALRH